MSVSADGGWFVGIVLLALFVLCLIVLIRVIWSRTVSRSAQKRTRNIDPHAPTSQPNVASTPTRNGHDEGHEHSHKAKAWWEWVLVVLLIAGLLAGGYYAYTRLNLETRSGCPAGGVLNAPAGEWSEWVILPKGCIHTTTSLPGPTTYELEFRSSRGIIETWTRSSPPMADRAEFRVAGHGKAIRHNYWFTPAE